LLLQRIPRKKKQRVRQVNELGIVTVIPRWSKC